jgi:hypothetical protein
VAIPPLQRARACDRVKQRPMGPVQGIKASFSFFFFYYLYIHLQIGKILHFNFVKLSSRIQENVHLVLEKVRSTFKNVDRI